MPRHGGVASGGGYMSSSAELSTTIQKNFVFLAEGHETAAHRVAKRLAARALKMW
jgi:hypothetical protein